MSDPIVRLEGTRGGERVQLDGVATIDARAIVVRAGDGEEGIVRLDAVQGAVVHASPMHDTLTLTTTSSDTYALSAADDGLEAFADFIAHALSTVFAMPEVMRGLRGFGSARAMPGTDHDRFFAPLVDALRAARVAHDRALTARALGKPWRAAESIDAARIDTSMRSTIANLAAERVPVSAPDRRAFEAELLDETYELFVALDTLGHAAQRLLSSDDDHRVSAWRAWCAALSACFYAADRSWLRVVGPLTEVRTSEKR